MSLTLSKNAHYCFLDDVVILLDQEEGVYYKMGAVGAWVWSQIVDGKSRDDIAAGMCARYGLTPEVARRDLDDLVEDLMDRGLVRPS